MKIGADRYTKAVLPRTVHRESVNSMLKQEVAGKVLVAAHQTIGLRQ